MIVALLVIAQMSFLAVPRLVGANRTAQEQEPTFQERYPRYRIHVGDVLNLHFPLTPEFNQTVTVQPDGYINLQGLADVRVGDKTTPEVVEMIRTAYNRILRDPIVTVELKEFEKPYFVVGGDVAKPGKYDFQGDITVMQAITIAGGFGQKSKKSEVLVFRRVSDQWAEVKKVDVKRMLQRLDLNEDLHLRPGDMVLIPQSKLPDFTRFIPIPSLGMYFNPLPH